MPELIKIVNKPKVIKINGLRISFINGLMVRLTTVSINAIEIILDISGANLNSGIK